MTGANTRAYEIIGAPFDLGSQTLGASAAPAVLREHGLVRRLERLKRRGIEVVDGGDVDAPTEGDDTTAPRNVDAFLSYCERLLPRLGAIYAADRVPIVLGGDHAITMATVSSAARHIRETHGPEAPLGLVYVDAHPDLESPKPKPSDLHGMSVTYLLGRDASELTRLAGFAPALDPANVVMIGLRDVMDEERAVIEDRDIAAYSASDIERLGFSTICEKTFEHMVERTAGFFLSFDVDACDPTIAPAVEYPEPGGLTFRELRLIMEHAARAPNLVGLEAVELIPPRDQDARTSKLVVELLWSALRGPVL